MLKCQDTDEGLVKLERKIWLPFLLGEKKPTNGILLLLQLFILMDFDGFSGFFLGCENYLRLKLCNLSVSINGKFFFQPPLLINHSIFLSVLGLNFISGSFLLVFKCF